MISSDEAHLLNQLIEKKATLGEKDQTGIDPKIMSLLERIVKENEDGRETVEGKKANKEAFNEFFISEVS